MLLFLFVFRTIQNFIIPQNQEVAADRQFIASHLDKDSSVASVFSFSVNVMVAMICLQCVYSGCFM